MPTRIFAITAARETVTLDNEGRAEVSFTASNTGSKPIAGRAKLVPLGLTKAAWLSLEGEQERSFAKGEAHQLTVHIAVPPGTPVGKYSFRLNIISVENPDDEFTEGPSVSFEVKELTVAQAPARKFPWWIVAVAGVLVVGGGLITWLLLPQKGTMPNVVGKSNQEPEKVKVPDMVGMPFEEAVNSLDTAKLKPAAKEEKVSGTQKPGIVIEQNPKAEEVVRVGSEVKLVVEVAPTTVAVPPVVGKPTSEAKDLLKDRDLAYEEADKRITGKFSPGRVVEQNPAEGAKVRPGTKVAVTVEAESVLVPPLIDRSIDDAKPILTKAKLHLETKPKPAGKKPGTIVDQNPQPNERVAPDTTITAFVEPEPEMVIVPDVIGVPADKVGPTFEVKKLQYVLGKPIITGKVQVGTIARQSPEKDQRVRVGTRVELAAEAESVVVPDVRNLVANEAISKLEMEALWAAADPGGPGLGDQTKTLVRSQSPAPGTRVAPYSSVTIRP
jgi:beta-lactam-binding protein with PASTA domain